MKLCKFLSFQILSLQKRTLRCTSSKWDSLRNKMLNVPCPRNSKIVVIVLKIVRSSVLLCRWFYWRSFFFNFCNGSDFGDSIPEPKNLFPISRLNPRQSGWLRSNLFLWHVSSLIHHPSQYIDTAFFIPVLLLVFVLQLPHILSMLWQEIIRGTRIRFQVLWNVHETKVEILWFCVKVHSF